MNLEEKIELELKEAMKARQADKTGTLRMVKAALINLKVEKRSERLSDEEIIHVIQKQVKQRKESIESFEKAGRQDLADKEKVEMGFLAAYLPPQLSADEMATVIRDIIAKTGATSKKDTGLVMKEAMAALRGKADGRMISQIVGELLS